MTCRSREVPYNVTDKVDTFEGAVLGLTEAVNRNSEEISENRTEIAEARQDISELHQKVDAFMKHFEVPYKPPTGFIKE